MITTTKLENILNSEPKEIKKDREIFSRLYITKDALTKAQAYAYLAEDERGAPTECYGFLLGDLNRRSRVVKDVYFAPAQEVSAARVRIPARKIIEAGREIRADYGKRVIGWWHSHANFNPFHSGTDDDNLKTVLNQIAPSNYLNIYEEMEFLDNIKKTREGDSTIIVCDKNNKSKRLEMIFSELGENPLIGAALKKLQIRIPIKISYAFSMVVNACGDHPYVEVATRKSCPVCCKSRYQQKQIPIKVLDYETGLNLSREELEKEVNDKLILPKPIFSIWSWPKKKKPKKKKEKEKKVEGDGGGNERSNK